MNIHECEIFSQKQIAAEIFELILKYDGEDPAPGQFVSIVPKDKNIILPRPISVCCFNKGYLKLVYKRLGTGTASIANLKPKEKINIIAPLGTGFRLTDHKNISIVGGGLGVPPLLELAKRLREKNTNANIKIYLGFRDESQVILVDEFKKYGEVIVTLDPSNPLEALASSINSNLNNDISKGTQKPDIIHTCGPYILMKRIAQYAKEENILCFTSLEQRMACTVGACLACVVKVPVSSSVNTLSANYDTNAPAFEYRRVCTATGPVFNANEVIWE
ncbi:MAG: hypothetical protein FWF50_07775 [Defluviitaleaceae bacterium]|nr:hypothetical protein [Defluviitaleaceae bacterium]